MLRSLRLDIGGRRWRRRLAIGGWRRRGHNLHLDAALGHNEVVDGAVASFKMCLEVQALGQQNANCVPLLQPDLVIGELGEAGVGICVRAGLDVVKRVRDPVWCAGDRGIETVSNLEKSLHRKVRGFETAGVRRAGDGHVEVGVRRRRKANADNIKGERGRVAGFFQDGGRLRVKARGGQEDEKRREQTEMSLNDAEHGHRTPCGNDTGE